MKLFKRRKKKTIQDLSPELIEKQILNILDDAYEHAEFPYLNSFGHWIYGKIRCCTFRSETKWLIIFEILRYYPGSGDFNNAIYAFGNQLKINGFQEYQGIIQETKIFRDKYDHSGIRVPNWDVDWWPDPLDFKIKINGNIQHFVLTENDYQNANIDIKESLSGDEVLDNLIYVFRYLVDHLPMDDIFLTKDMLLDYIGKPLDMPPFITLTDWIQPGKNGISKPSESPSFISLAKALSENNPSLFENNNIEPNTHWSYWKEYLQK